MSDVFDTTSAWIVHPHMVVKRVVVNKPTPPGSWVTTGLGLPTGCKIGKETMWKAYKFIPHFKNLSTNYKKSFTVPKNFLMGPVGKIILKEQIFAQPARHFCAFVTKWAIFAYFHHWMPKFYDAILDCARTIGLSDVNISAFS